MQQILLLLEQLNIRYDLAEHEAVYTCEQAESVKGLIKGQGCKNLFLKNAKKEYFLYVLPDDRKADLKRLGKDNGLGHLSFGGEQELSDILGLKPGGVTPLGMINDKENKVTLVLDGRLKGKTLLLHPNVNTATVSIVFDDLIKLIEYEKHRYIITT